MPARITAPPRTNSRPYCRPAVPPPPVTGATVGNEVLGDGDGDGEGLGLGLTLTDGDGLTETDTDEVGGVTVMLVLTLVEAVDVDVMVPMGEPPDGVNTDVVVVDPDEQAETPAAPSRIKAPQPNTVNLTLIA